MPDASLVEPKKGGPEPPKHGQRFKGKFFHTHKHLCTHLHIHIHTLTHTFTHTYAHLHTFTHAYTYLHTLTHLHTLSNKDKLRHTHTLHTHLHTFTHTYTHVNALTHTRTHTNLRVWVHAGACGCRRMWETKGQETELKQLLL